MDKINSTRKHIFLVGFMGAGKSYWGKQLADALKLRFVDLDTYIEQQVGMSITAIFSAKGEDFFRSIESKALQEICAQTNPVVLALGGGTPCFLNNNAILKAHGTSFFLDIEEEILFQRLFKASSKRPLLHNKTKEELRTYIKKMLTIRTFFYRQSDVYLKTPIALESFLKKLLQ